MEAIALVFGLFLLALTFWDLFETVVVPRPTPGWFRIGRYVVRGSWRVIRAIRERSPSRNHDRLLGLFAPARTPSNVIDRLHAATAKAVQRPEASERFASMGADVVGSTPAQLGAHLRSEMDRWSKLAKEVKFELAD